ncbi:hypothetical protein SR870_15945 [Rhodopseudomonas palustris]|uniref:hypothetical protein n=1 Tax=Rhodopseudomonas palustris TaxID=1076 RepID=UPI002ACE5F80|nr:hypothetical protein [Rhodopseudomonas palustris]WQG98188.1 hypothetical protein SR870_15945 [Rhodopseudomonas palustris]
MLDYPRLTRRAIAAAGFAATAAVLQVSATEGAVASNQAITTPVKLGVLEQGVATSETEAAAADRGAATGIASSVSTAPAATPIQAAGTASASGAMAKAPAPAAKRMRGATAPRSLRRPEAGEAPGGASWQRRHFVLMLGIGY